MIVHSNSCEPRKYNVRLHRFLQLLCLSRLSRKNPICCQYRQYPGYCHDTGNTFEIGDNILDYKIKAFRVTILHFRNISFVKG